MLALPTPVVMVLSLTATHAKWGWSRTLASRRQLLRSNWFATLDAALRYVAKRENIPLIDLEAIHLQLPAAHVYQWDGTHPLGEVLIAVCVNLLLNMHEQSLSSGLLAITPVRLP